MPSKPKVAYNQTITHLNESPDVFPPIKQVNSIFKTYQHPNLPRPKTQEELLSRSPCYVFMVYLKSKTVSALPVHKYIFEDEKLARETYKKCMYQWINEQIEPYRKKVKKGHILTLDEMERCEKIQALIDDDF